LFTYLCDHPDIYGSPLKEINHFLPIRFGKLAPPLSNYQQYFKKYGAQAYRLEASPAYFYGGLPLASAVEKLLPNAKILIILRDPVARLISFFNFHKNMLNLPSDMTLLEYIENCSRFSLSDFKDEKWQGFEGDNLDVTINLKSIKPVNQVEIRFMSNNSAWIFLPEDIKIFWSANGVDYKEYSNKSEAGETMPLPDIHAFSFCNEGIKARYIRIKATNIGVCPEGHPGSGGKAWLFSDEIIVR